MTSPLPISFGPQVCGSLSEGSAREWLLTDGLGGYAMGTVSGLRTRRYHGLLMVAGPSPATRHLGLVALDPVLRSAGGGEVRLGTHEWASGAIGPEGYRHLESFELRDGLPTWRWRIGGVVLERTLALQHGRPALAVVHRLVSGGPVELRLDALCTWRDAHGERHASDDLGVEPVAGGAVVAGGVVGAGAVGCCCTVGSCCCLGPESFGATEPPWPPVGFTRAPDRAHTGPGSGNGMSG